jgi:hypothetical protein
MTGPTSTRGVRTRHLALGRILVGDVWTSTETAVFLTPTDESHPALPGIVFDPASVDPLALVRICVHAGGGLSAVLDGRKDMSFSRSPRSSSLATVHPLLAIDIDQLSRAVGDRRGCRRRWIVLSGGRIPRS